MQTTTTHRFANRVEQIPRSFIRDILKVTTQDIISFAGGLPNAGLFPVEALVEATEKVLRQDGAAALQYSVTEGYLPLRAYLAERYTKKQGLHIDAEDIVILSGAQQGIDLLGKQFIDKGDVIALEAPSYLGAIQAFSAYEPKIITADLAHDGIDLDALWHTLRHDPRFFYCIPDHQNPTGISYAQSKREAVAHLAAANELLIIEDGPYAELDFTERNTTSIHALHPQGTVHLGSFSKMISPSLRLGWAIGPRQIVSTLSLLKQASDLHANFLGQKIIYQFLLDNDLDAHLAQVRSFYAAQAKQMLHFLGAFFGDGVHFTIPQGGMFTWLTLPGHMDAQKIMEKAKERKVIFVPGAYFYHGEKKKNTLRLNFSHASLSEMEQGLKILAEIIHAEM